MPYHCRHCGGTYCGDHRLPESHNCSGLQDWDSPGGVFDSGFDDSVNESESTLQTRIAGTGGLLGYFRGNMTFVFLGIMAVVFLLQHVISPLVGIGLRTQLALFTLNPADPLYVWTWITSIFSHGGPFHLLFNGIVLFFFGPIVERKIGSKKFIALFLGSGIAAGFVQIAIGYLTGDAAPLLGASGAIMAVMGVLTVLNPELRVLLYGIIPVPLWVLTLGFAALSALGMISGSMGGVAHGAHLAGLVIGLAYGQRVKARGMSAPGRLQLGGGRGPGGPGGPGRGRGPF